MIAAFICCSNFKFLLLHPRFFLCPTRVRIHTVLIFLNQKIHQELGSISTNLNCLLQLLFIVCRWCLPPQVPPLFPSFAGVQLQPRLATVSGHTTLLGTLTRLTTAPLGKEAGMLGKNEMAEPCCGLVACVIPRHVGIKMILSG